LELRGPPHPKLRGWGTGLADVGALFVVVVVVVVVCRGVSRNPKNVNI